LVRQARFEARPLDIVDYGDEEGEEGDEDAS